MTAPRRVAPSCAAPAAYLPAKTVGGGGSRRSLLLAPLAALALWLALAGPAQAAPTTIAAGGQGAGKVSAPTGIAVNSTGAGGVAPGTLYVADFNNRRIDRFGPAGTFQLAWGFGVADGKSLELQHCGPEASPPRRRCFESQEESRYETGAGAMLPTSVAVDQATGDVYVIDRKYRIQEFGPGGEFLAAFGAGVVSGGAEGTGDTEAGSQFITSVSPTRKAFLTGQALSGPGIQPGTVVKEAESRDGGRLLISKPATQTAAGISISAPEGPENVPLNETQAISIGAGVSGGDFRLEFTPPEPEGDDTQTTASIPYDAPASEVREALEGLSNVGAGNVEVTGSGGAGGTFTVEFKGARYADTDVSELALLAGQPPLSGGEATLATTTQGASSQELCTTAIACVSGVKASGSAGRFFGSSTPSALAVGPEGRVWVAEGSRLLVFDSAGHYLSEAPLPGGRAVTGLALDGAEPPHLYALEPPAGGKPGRVEKLQPSGAPPNSLTELEAIDEGGEPQGLAVDAAGELYVSDCGPVTGNTCSVPYRLKAFDPAGELASLFGAGQVFSAEFANAGPQGNALALDEAGASLYTASSHSEEVKFNHPVLLSRVQRFDLPEARPAGRSPAAARTSNRPPPPSRRR